MTGKTLRRRSTLTGLQNEIARMFGNRDWPFGLVEDEDSIVTEWAPAVDVSENDKQFTVRADLPGVDPNDIEVTMENGMLILRGERKEERKEEKEGYHRVERFSGTFFRRLALPDAADADKIDAHVDKGVLEIIIPKAEKARARRVQIKS